MARQCCQLFLISRKCWTTLRDTCALVPLDNVSDCQDEAMLLKHLSSNLPHSSHKQLQFVATTIEYEPVLVKTIKPSIAVYFLVRSPDPLVYQPSQLGNLHILNRIQYYNAIANQIQCEHFFVFYLLKVACSAWYWQDRFNESILSCCLVRYSAKYLIFRSTQEFIRYTNETSAKYGNIGINWFTAIVYICFNFQWWRKISRYHVLYF